MGTHLIRVPRDTPFKGPGARQFPTKAQMFGVQCLQLEMVDHRNCGLILIIAMGLLPTRDHGFVLDANHIRGKKAKKFFYQYFSFLMPFQNPK